MVEKIKIIAELLWVTIEGWTHPLAAIDILNDNIVQLIQTNNNLKTENNSLKEELVTKKETITTLEASI